MEFAHPHGRRSLWESAVTARIYLDYAATTPVRREVLEAMLCSFSERPYNASSAHAEGRAARAALDSARQRVAACLHAKPKEIVFTGSGSEADNLALLGAARAQRARGRHVLSTAIEHHAVLHALSALEDEGFEVTLLPVQPCGVIDVERFAAALRRDTVLASVMYVNNELGTVQPIAQLARAARRNGTLFHTDAVQAAAYFSLDVRELEVDLLSLAAHKFYGPKGVGALYVREQTAIAPVLHGGGQEFGKRPGTENVAGIEGLALALELAQSERNEASERVGVFRDAFEAQLARRLPSTRINGAQAPRAPHISNVAWQGIRSDQLLMRLDLDGVAASAGSACASGVIEPSHVIAALGLDCAEAAGVMRFSFGRPTQPADVDRALEVLERAVQDLQELPGAGAQDVLLSKTGNSWFASGA